MKSDKKEDKEKETREKDRTKNKDKHKNRDRDKSREKDKDKSRNKSEKDKEKNKDKEKSKNQDRDRSKSKDKKKKKKKYSKSKSVSKSKSRSKYQSVSRSPSNHKRNQSTDSEKSSNHKKKKIKKNISAEEIKPIKSSQKQQQQQSQQSSFQQQQQTSQQQQSQQPQQQQQLTQPQEKPIQQQQQPQAPNSMPVERNSQENITSIPQNKLQQGFFPHQQYPHQFPGFFDPKQGIAPFGVPYPFMPPGMLMSPHFKPTPMFQPGQYQFPRFLPPFAQGMPQMHDLKFQELAEDRQNENSNISQQNQQQKFNKFGGVGPQNSNIPPNNAQTQMNQMYKKNYPKGQNKPFPHNQKMNWGDHNQNQQQNRRKDSARKKLQDGCLFKNLASIPKSVEVFANTQVSLKIVEPNLYLNISKKLLYDLQKTAKELNMQNTTKSINKFLINLTEIQKKEKENKDKQLSKNQQKKKSKLKSGDNQTGESNQNQNKQVNIMEEIEFLSYLHETKDLEYIQYYGNLENYRISNAIQPIKFEACEEQQSIFEEAKQLFLKKFNA